MIGDSNVETNFPYKLLLPDRQVSKSRKAFANNLLANIKLSQTQLSKIVQSGGFLPLSGLLAQGVITPHKEEFVIKNIILNQTI